MPPQPRSLDGTLDEYPDREEAKLIYRQCWESFLLSRDPIVQRALMQAMDNEQTRICRGPGPLWEAFAASLPGYLEFWGRWADDVMHRLERRGSP